ncbi:actin cytoskeleton-regulatory complex protein PAN1-like [Monomorium pharaonis]|uniref:actin cytoskeleton-regulatory complex protein PAN1-like n=1 Tax=Monomorium pharaonis TaxID=307658 RepID=UPI001746ABE8|nr:actin cytoskeleton-regulatory complex protein PAN1-like [Monomorium pharaonis]
MDQPKTEGSYKVDQYAEAKELSPRSSRPCHRRTSSHPDEPFEATVRPTTRDQRRDNEPPSTAAPAPTPVPALPSGPRRPAVARQRTTRSRQEWLYVEAPPATDNGRSILLATFGSTLSDLDDDDDDNGEPATAPEERTSAPMPDIALLRITGPGTTAPPVPSRGTTPAGPPPATIPEPAPPLSVTEAHQQAVAVPPPPA